MPRAKSGAAAFTLVEMLVVITIIAVIAGITIPLFVSTRATTRRNDAVNAVQSALAAAREAAIMRRTIVAIEFVSNPADPLRGDFMVLVDKSNGIPGAQRRLGAQMRLPDFVKFDFEPNAAPPPNYVGTTIEWTVENGWDGDPNDDFDTNALIYLPGTVEKYPDIAYRPDGTVADFEGTTRIALVDVSSDPARNVLRVLPVTGLVTRAVHLQDPALAESPTNVATTGWLTPPPP